MACLSASAVRSPMATPCSWRTKDWMEAFEVEAAAPDGPHRHHPAQRDHAPLRGFPRDVDHHGSPGSWMAKGPAPMAAAIGCSMRKLDEAPARRVAS